MLCSTLATLIPGNRSTTAAAQLLAPPQFELRPLDEATVVGVQTLHGSLHGSVIVRLAHIREQVLELSSI